MFPSKRNKFANVKNVPPKSAQGLVMKNIGPCTKMLNVYLHNELHAGISRIIVLRRALKNNINCIILF